METYKINGVSLQYDTFDLDRLEAYTAEIEIMQEAAKQMESALDEAKTPSEQVDILRNHCAAVFDFFDNVVGEGTSTLLFGSRCNLKEVMTAYSDFAEQVSQQIDNFGASASEKKVSVIDRRAKRNGT